MQGKVRSFFILWGVVLVLNQVIIFGSCFNPTCIIAALPHTGILSFIIFLYFDRKVDLDGVGTDEIDDLKPFEELKKEKVKKTFTKQRQKDPLKEMGDKYEKHIGSKFEEQGSLVIYNGFIKGYDDKGVDIISISKNKQEINLIQCKNWVKKRMDINDIKDIYSKLNSYNLDCLSINISEIQGHLTQYKSLEIEEQYIHVQQYRDTYNIRKTLYASSDKVMDLNIGEYLTMIKPNIFRYRDMKIVIESSKY